MFTDLETERLHLKSIGCDDVDFMYREFSTDAVNAYLYDAEPMSSKEEARGWIDFYTQPEPRDSHRWILVLKASGEKIGTCGFHCWDRDACAVEVGYDLQPAFWRQGYISEALRAILAFAKADMQVKTVAAHIAEGNTASLRTAEKLGFIRTDETYDEVFRGKKYRHFVYLLEM